MAVPRPRPGFLDRQVRVRRKGYALWKSPAGDRYYTWDGLHGEVEVWDSQGRHLGAANATTGKTVKKAVRGRKIEL
ncbi:MAG: hypothetical protein HS107_07560 [Thermoflexaceae bacterium]|nr:hypothetical protein [Thermoflexaceae bacterium]